MDLYLERSWKKKRLINTIILLYKRMEEAGLEPIEKYMLRWTDIDGVNRRSVGDSMAAHRNA